MKNPSSGAGARDCRESGSIGLHNHSRILASQLTGNTFWASEFSEHFLCAFTECR